MASDEKERKELPVPTPGMQRVPSAKALRRQMSASRFTLDKVLTHLKQLETMDRPHFVYTTFVHQPAAVRPQDAWSVVDDYEGHMKQLGNPRVLQAEALSPERLSNELFQHGDTLALLLRLYGHIRGLRRSVYVRREVVEVDVPRRQNFLFWMLDGVVGVARQQLVQYLVVVAPVVRDLRKLMFRQMLDLIALDSVDSDGSRVGGDPQDRDLHRMFTFHRAILDYVSGSTSRRKAVAKAADALRQSPSSSSSDYESGTDDEADLSDFSSENDAGKTD